MIEFYTPSLLITEYYDSLISQLDIYTEERQKEINKIVGQKSQIEPIENFILRKKINIETTYREEAITNPYKSQIYAIDRTVFSVPEEISEISQAECYLNNVRQKAIDEIRKVQDENLEHYKSNKELFNVNKENQTEEKLEELKSQLFSTRFCFLVSKKAENYCPIKEKNPEKYIPLCNLHTVITDFYLRESDIDFIRKSVDCNYEIKHPSTKLDKIFLLANQVQKYVKEALDEDVNGYEVLQINKRTLIDIHHVEVRKADYLRFNEVSFDIDLSSIKSLSLEACSIKIIDLSAFLNLEYLSITGFKLSRLAFQNLKKLINITISDCDLSEFDFDSLNLMTSLQIICIDYDKSLSSSFKIDLNRLINLKWLDLRYINKVSKNCELITNSSNQLNKIKLVGQALDFSKQIDLRELKSLEISKVKLSRQIRPQFFSDMTSLIVLNLNTAQLTNVDFLNTDRLGNLEILELAHNLIKVLKLGTFSQLRKLKSLNLDYNRIIELVAGVFEGLECLELLNIRTNDFDVESIDKRVFGGLNSLKNLYITNFKTRFANVDYLKTDSLIVH